MHFHPPYPELLVEALVVLDRCLAPWVQSVFLHVRRSQNGLNPFPGSIAQTAATGRWGCATLSRMGGGSSSPTGSIEESSPASPARPPGRSSTSYELPVLVDLALSDPGRGDRPPVLGRDPIDDDELQRRESLLGPQVVREREPCGGLWACDESLHLRGSLSQARSNRRASRCCISSRGTSVRCKLLSSASLRS